MNWRFLNAFRWLNEFRGCRSWFFYFSWFLSSLRWHCSLNIGTPRAIFFWLFWPNFWSNEPWFWPNFLDHGFDQNFWDDWTKVLVQLAKCWTNRPKFGPKVDIPVGSFKINNMLDLGMNGPRFWSNRPSFGPTNQVLDQRLGPKDQVLVQRLGPTNQNLDQKMWKPIFSSIINSFQSLLPISAKNTISILSQEYIS